MHLRDLSLKTKLLVTNALMVVIPICVLVAIGAALLGGLRHAGTLQQQALELLWPERGTNLSSNGIMLNVTFICWSQRVSAFLSCRMASSI